MGPPVLCWAASGTCPGGAPRRVSSAMLRAALHRLLGREDPAAPEPVPSPGGGGLALVLTGGGARAAYQAGVLRGLAQHFPTLRPGILTGVSAGALNASFLATRAHLPIRDAAEALVRIWHDLRAEHVYRLDRPSVMGSVVRFVRRPDEIAPPAEGGLLDTSPLQAFVEAHLGPLGEPIEAIAEAVRSGALHAFALTTTSYTTGQSITWVQGEGVEPWDRATRRAVRTDIRPEHVLASSALPFFFPAVRIDDAQAGPGWYGDGGIRLTAPLSPALHLGADKILAVNTRYAPTAREADRAEVRAYPPPGSILGVLMNAVFLDVLDRDAQTLGRINALIRSTPPAQRNGFRPVDFMVLRPSVDLGSLAGDFEPQLPPSMRVLLGGLGAGEQPDWLSMLLFDPGYVERLVEIGEADVTARSAELADFLEL